jgi:hypothetical protein
MNPRCIRNRTKKETKVILKFYTPVMLQDLHFNKENKQRWQNLRYEKNINLVCKIHTDSRDYLPV